MILDNKAAIDRVKSRVSSARRATTARAVLLAVAESDRPALPDVRVRQAIDHAIDRQSIITAVEKGFGKVANTAIVPAFKTYYDPSHESKYPYDAERAKQLLSRRAGSPGADGVLQKDGQPFRFTMDVGQRGVLQPTNELIQQNLKTVGVFRST